MHDVRFKTPSTTIISGPSNSGKTSLLFKILRRGEELLEYPKCLQNILYYYKQWQPGFDELSAEMNIIYVNSVPSVDNIREKTQDFSQTGGSIIIVDDFMQELTTDVSVLFSTLSHHLNITVFLLTQNLFSKNPVFRDISLNATYNIIFKNPRDASQITHFAKQYAPGKASFIMAAYKDATKKPHSYILFDNHQVMSDDVRIRSNILQENHDPVKVWLYK